MNKNFALLSIIAIAEAVKLNCGPCSNGCDLDDGSDAADDIEEPIIELPEDAVTLFIFENDDCTGESLTLDLSKDLDVAIDAVLDAAALF